MGALKLKPYWAMSACDIFSYTMNWTNEQYIQVGFCFKSPCHLIKNMFFYLTQHGDYKCNTFGLTSSNQ